MRNKCNFAQCQFDPYFELHFYSLLNKYPCLEDKMTAVYLTSILPSPGFIKAEMGRLAAGHATSPGVGERTPTRPKAGDRVTLGSHGNSAFQPITASCKIVPQGQPPSPAESPGKSFQPITMSCKIVSGKCSPLFHIVSKQY